MLSSAPGPGREEADEMTGSRSRRVLLAAMAGAIGVAHATAGGPDASSPEARPFLRSGDDVIVPLSNRRRCETAEYVGPETILYADRPYHTEAAVPELVGLQFCRGRRHGQAIWLLEVGEPTTLYALAAEKHALARDGWNRSDSRVRVEATGLAFDRLYSKRLEPGLYGIRYGRATTAHPIFWNGDHARVATRQPLGP